MTDELAADLGQWVPDLSRWIARLSDEQRAKWNVGPAAGRNAQDDDPVLARNALLKRAYDAERAGRWTVAETLFVADSDAFEVCHDGVFWADGWNARRLKEATTVRRTR
jgi:hypothetical protein